jgi:hypothetical protein
MAVVIAFLTVALASASPPQTAARDFLRRYLKQDKAVGNFEGGRVLAPFLSARLRRVLDNASACELDWARQQPKGSTDKPPFVDCCLFASSPEGIPTSFELGPAERLPDIRHRVFVDFTYADSPGTYSDPTIRLQTSHWRDALVMVQAGGRYLVDDFIFLRDVPHRPPLLLSESFQGCRERRWIGAR